MSHTNYLLTSEVLAMFSIPESRLRGMFATGKLKRPIRRDASGRMLWDPEIDVAAIRRALSTDMRLKANRSAPTLLGLTPGRIC